MSIQPEDELKKKKEKKRKTRDKRVSVQFRREVAHSRGKNSVFRLLETKRSLVWRSFRERSKNATRFR